MKEVSIEPLRKKFEPVVVEKSDFENLAAASDKILAFWACHDLEKKTKKCRHQTLNAKLTARNFQKKLKTSHRFSTETSPIHRFDIILTDEIFKKANFKTCFGEKLSEK